MVNATTLIGTALATGLVALLARRFAPAAVMFLLAAGIAFLPGLLTSAPDTVLMSMSQTAAPAAAAAEDSGGVSKGLLVVALLTILMGAAFGATFAQMRIRPDGLPFLGMLAELAVTLLMFLLVYIFSGRVVWILVALFVIAAWMVIRWRMRIHRTGLERARTRTDQGACLGCNCPNHHPVPKTPGQRAPAGRPATSKAAR